MASTSRLLLVLPLAMAMSSCACSRTQGAALAPHVAMPDADAHDWRRAPAGAGVTLPADFPMDVYLPRQRHVASVIDMAGMHMVNLSSPDSMQALSIEVEASMRADGWKREMAMQAGDSATLMYSKEQRHAVYQLVGSDSRGTQLAVRTGSNG